MKKGSYKDPKYPIEKRAKIACVIPVYVGIHPKTGYPLRGIKSYERYLNYQEDKLESIKFTLGCYEHYNAGVDYDLIIVNNSSINETAINYLDKLQENGTTVIKRENLGFSFGAYKYAWEAFGDRYDYYLFHEQDIVPCKDGWLSEIVMAFLSNKDIGAIGNKLESRGYGHPTSDIILNASELTQKRGFMFNLDGAFTFTSSAILKKVDNIGGLTIVPCSTDDKEGAVINETMFQQPILELGYTICAMEDSDTFSTLGISIVEFEGESIIPQKLSPMIHGHVRNTIKWFKNYFNWFTLENGK